MGGPPLWMSICNGYDVGCYTALSRYSKVLSWALITTEVAVSGTQTWGNLDRLKLCSCLEVLWSVELV
jgi:hypothetical protein